MLCFLFLWFLHNFSHLIKDLLNILPHAKKEPKIDSKKERLAEFNDVFAIVVVDDLFITIGRDGSFLCLFLCFFENKKCGIEFLESDVFSDNLVVV